MKKKLKFNGMTIYPDRPIKDMGLSAIVDNGTTYVTIPTPKGWKCKRKNCTTSFKHKHTTYDALR